MRSNTRENLRSQYLYLFHSLNACLCSLLHFYSNIIQLFQGGSDNKYANQQSRQYLPPSARGYDDGSNGEPANYDFEYMVQDAPSDNDFGHRESRRGGRRGLRESSTSSNLMEGNRPLNMKPTRTVSSPESHTRTSVRLRQ
ncbi:unnamed protein product [Danaus chrysippus]|uniref:(African queen) hypothetical protein n=1 Tax=Danaus chrysippus TaxID=151541 RepID=A0A8J2VXJ3_9NEOP|nr:unnamed protein product [Danaus chrysippus]